ncbi:hypothetical protein KUCAC02_012184 [Chaenocephalus aceratus]|uniref:Uncharacterized protein n=1 Tax=Chaenocephalus aceratus TaxID=36190 RepID=A0ACB9XBX1_CHAAC|nr:hypothetical protein KUCAC02_012184 [Chaenocephalus aceratus]
MDVVPLAAPSATPKPIKPIDLEECILCQKKNRSEYLSSGEIGRGYIVSLAKQTESNDTRAARVLRLTVQEQGIMKYHTSSCYRSFQRDMAKTDSITQPLEQSEPSQQGPVNDTSERHSKRFKSSVTTDVCIFCGSDCKTFKQKKIHTLFRICERPMTQKLLHVAMLFKVHAYTETAAMCKLDDVFASAHSLTSIRDRLNEGSAGIVSNRTVKQLIIEMYGDAVCFTYPSNKRISQMVLCTNSSKCNTAGRDIGQVSQTINRPEDI